MSTEKLTSHVSLIWNIAEILRGDYKEHEYGDVVLPFTVLTRLDSVLVDTKQAVLNIKATSVPSKIKELQYAKATGYPLWNTSNFTLKTLLDDPDNLEQNLSYYVQAFAPAAREVMEAYSFYNVIERLDKAGLLYQVLSEFTSSKVNLHPDVVSNDQMGYIFEELIRRFSELSNETAGEHFTPREVISLMVNLLFNPEEDINRLCADGAMASLYDPGVGTGGMLSIAAQHVEDLNDTARLEVYGQELNPQTYAVAKSDIMIKGERQERIYFGNSLTNDQTAGLRFDYMLCNPPFGVNWKKYAGPIHEEAERKEYQGRFGAGTPRISDGSFLFLQHMISKMKPYDPQDFVNAPGTRIGIVFNGSPLFTGRAGQGESEIRRWILENDWLEAIIALPDQMFYNTGILTYIWVLSNKKERRRKKKVQLIDATSYFQRMRKPLGEKRKKLTPEHIADITRIYGEFQETEVSKIFDTEDFAYHEVTVERPLRLSFQASPETLEALKGTKPFTDLATSRKRTEPARTEEIEVGKRVQAAIIATLEALNAEHMYLNRDEFTDLLREGIKERGEKIGIVSLRKVVAELSAKNPAADICVDAKGNPEPDADLRDTEQIPLREDIEAYFQREVIPYAPDAWIDHDKTKIGYEIPFTRYFYKYEELGDPVETLTEIQALSASVQADIAKLFSEQVK
ncbi:type I restriction-modification system subunit M [Corynebacterium urealyticum]|uniref:type I restriction-modification system subunit M n=1 Tax=Corynebacterium urealyticum TaxID=43771 RepID=UPI0011E85975|nr:class I SAM-dependent DNA methyltransferase [Corynebacterium urealyticum]TYR16290.1 SAM-dependent DNA methyltransferase [Corynebacterium urealyticum]